MLLWKNKEYKVLMFYDEENEKYLLLIQWLGPYNLEYHK